MSTQKSIVLLYTMNNLKRKFKKQFHLQWHHKELKNQELTVEVRDMYNGNYKT